ncbi:hypothetical protein, partial [Glaciihabitans sp. UYNi722]|uniref:hypothetical protein n=1 Tax=Glaciihabitans sp. UYNi722 TaxID=3156344 RepID=UPI003392FB7F
LRIHPSSCAVLWFMRQMNHNTTQLDGRQRTAGSATTGELIRQLTLNPTKGYQTHNQENR